MINVCANQQGTNVSTLPPSSAFDVGEPIIAEEQAAPSSRPYEMAANITAIDTNRLTASVSALSVTTNVWSITRATAWTGGITGVVSATFASENAARYYFNSGGQIRLHGSQPTGTPEDDKWNDHLVNGMGLVKFAAHATTNTGTSPGGTSIGYYGLTNSYQTIFTSTYSGGGSYYYSGNRIIISAKRLNYVGLNGGNGNGVQFQIQLLDTAPYYSVTVDAGTNFKFDNVKATTYLSGIGSPTYVTVSGF